MDKKKANLQQVDVNFESHPPIESDQDGLVRLIRQTLLQFVECEPLASYLIKLKDVTQIIALEEPEEENDDDEDEPDDDIYGVSSIIELPVGNSSDKQELEARKKLLKFLTDKSSDLAKLIDSQKDSSLKLGLIVNERYINLPPQLSLPTLKNLTQHLDKSQFSHLIFVSKILIKSRSSDTKLQSKKSKSSQSGSKSGDAEPLVFVHPEEEIIFENCDKHVDIDVSSFCDENASWAFGSDVKYIPHRRIMIVNYDNWPKVLKSLEQELK